MKRRGKKVSLWTAGMGLVVLVGLGIALQDTIREQWYLLKLETADGDELLEVVHALADMRSARAAPFILKASTRARLQKDWPWDMLPAVRVFDDTKSFAEALVKVGEPAVSALIEAILDERRGSVPWVIARYALFHISDSVINESGLEYPDDENDFKKLFEAVAHEEAFDVETRRAAVAALESLNRK